MTESTLTLRLASSNDDRELRRLAALDTAPVPAAPSLLAKENGRLIAAVSLVDGSEISDPFVSSGGALEVLRMRAVHIRGERLPSRRRLRRWLQAVGRNGHRPGSLAGSPPGAGGRLLDLSSEQRALAHPR